MVKPKRIKKQIKKYEDLENLKALQESAESDWERSITSGKSGSRSKSRKKSISYVLSESKSSSKRKKKKKKSVSGSYDDESLVFQSKSDGKSVDLSNVIFGKRIPKKPVRYEDLENLKALQESAESDWDKSVTSGLSSKNSKSVSGDYILSNASSGSDGSSASISSIVSSLGSEAGLGSGGSFSNSGSISKSKSRSKSRSKSKRKSGYFPLPPPRPPKIRSTKRFKIKKKSGYIPIPPPRPPRNRSIKRFKIKNKSRCRFGQSKTTSRCFKSRCVTPRVRRNYYRQYCYTPGKTKKRRGKTYVPK